MATTTNWVIDPAHSEIQFKVKHMVITTVTGSFKEFNGAAQAADDFDNAQISFEANVDSVTTNNDQRDGHLKGADFFEVEKFPKLSFVSTRFTKSGDGKFDLAGDLTIKGITKPVVFDVDFGGVVEDPYGQTKAGFSLNGKINRKQFGLSWDAITDAGSVVVGEEVRFAGEIQLVKQVVEEKVAA